MNHIQILRRAWKIIWSYKAIWFFGILLALTTTSGTNGGNNGGGSSSGNSNSLTPQFTPPVVITGWVETLNNWFTYIFSPQGVSTLIPIIVGLVCFVLILAVVVLTIHNISQVALIRMVDQYEATGVKAGIRQGFHFGWSRAAWRIFLIDLVIILPVIFAFIILFGLAAIPVLLGMLLQNHATVFGVIATVGLAFLLIFLAIVVYVFLAVILEPIRRICTLEGKGVFDSIRDGWQLVRRNFGNVFLMWLILVGIQIAYMVLLIPIFLVLALAGGLGGGGIGVGLFFLIRALGNETAAWITGIGLGILLFLLILGLPLLFVGGIKESYISTTWTLVYRQLRPMIISTPLPSGAEPTQSSQPLTAG